jgi:hypothetical protein
MPSRGDAVSLHRQAAKRDTNEEAIRAALHARGWHTEQVSGKGMPDLIGWSKHRVNVHLLEVKMPGKDATDAQVKKWQELLLRGIHVYVLRTTEDVQALTLGHHGPWLPPLAVHPPTGLCSKCRHLLSAHAKRRGCTRAHNRGIGTCGCKGPSGATAKRYASLGSPAIAAETFAPPAPLRCGCTREMECAEHSKVGL